MLVLVVVGRCYAEAGGRCEASWRPSRASAAQLGGEMISGFEGGGAASGGADDGGMEGGGGGGAEEGPESRFPEAAILPTRVAVLTALCTRLGPAVRPPPAGPGAARAAVAPPPAPNADDAPP